VPNGGPNDDGRTVFDAYVLLSEPIRFHPSEIIAALTEDYPALDIRCPEGLEQTGELDALCDTDRFITVPLMLWQGVDQGIVSLIRLPGYGTWDPDALDPNQRVRFHDVADALRQNRSYICVSVGARGNDLTSRFRAARLCSCIAAVFARLPVALAVYWEKAGHFLSPAQTIEMADTAMADSWPFRDWIGLRLKRGTHEGMSMSMGVSHGVVDFAGYEFSFAPAPVELHWVAALLWGCSRMALEHGTIYKDGDTMSDEGQERAKACRLRHVPKGTSGSSADTILIVHPDSPTDHEAIVGPITSRPPPPGVDNTAPDDPGFFKRLLRGGRRDS
jgi:hypothetical protein